MNTLDHIEKIISLVNKNGLNGAFLKSAHKHLDIIAQLLQINHVQVTIFALLLDHFGEYSVSIDDFADIFKCKKIQLLRYMEDFETLKHKKLIRETSSYRDHTKDNRVEYTIPLDVINAIRKGIEYGVKSTDNLSPIEFFDFIDDLLSSLREEDIDRETILNELKDLFQRNKDICFVKTQRKHDLSDISMLITLNLCCALAFNDEEKIDMDDFHQILGHHDYRLFQRGLKTKEHELCKKGFVEYDFQKGFVDTHYCLLSQKAKDEFLADITLNEIPKNKGKNFIPAENISIKNLFYNEKINGRINELTTLLENDNFIDIQKRLCENGMRTGFACIFTGPPGTGKTETVYQIAHKTGRDILLVNISETKSCWFGESEKLIKGVFDQYRSLVQIEDTIPILLFNEADAVLGKRRELSNTNDGLHQTENAIQNIILQEMEDLNGILIATTNMTVNLDKAFERRFLYKIEFEKPDIESRKKIWLSYFPAIKDKDVNCLAAQFDFSGGQIENIARKSTV